MPVGVFVCVCAHTWRWKLCEMATLGVFRFPFDHAPSRIIRVQLDSDSPCRTKSSFQIHPHDSAMATAATLIVTGAVAMHPAAVSGDVERLYPIIHTADRLDNNWTDESEEMRVVDCEHAGRSAVCIRSVSHLQPSPEATHLETFSPVAFASVLRNEPRLPIGCLLFDTVKSRSDKYRMLHGSSPAVPSRLKVPP